MSNDKKIVPPVADAVRVSFVGFLNGGVPPQPSEPRQAVAAASATNPLVQPK